REFIASHLQTGRAASFFLASRRRHTRSKRDWSSDVCSSDLDEERALNGLEEASKYVSKDRLYLSHQCGFASCDGGNELTHENQWDKIKQGQAIAFKYFGE